MVTKAKAAAAEDVVGTQVEYDAAEVALGELIASEEAKLPRFILDILSRATAEQMAEFKQAGARVTVDAAAKARAG